MHQSATATPASKNPAAASQSPRTQSKLVIGKTDDQYEEEADRIAEKITSMPAPALQKDCACGGSCAECQAKKKLQRKEAGEGSQLHTAPDIVQDALRSEGAPLDAQTRDFMEPRFGYSFSNVRLHADDIAARSAKAVNARAYTVGNDIVFGAGEYNAGTTQGKKLIAHEIVHTLQQEGKDQVVQRQDAGKSAEDSRGGTGWKGPAKCGPFFCLPFATKTEAEIDQAISWPIFRAGIAAFVNTRVLPVWEIWANGGSGLLNFTSVFGNDFAASPTTASTTKFLIGELQNALQAKQPVLPAGKPVVLDIPTLIPAAVKAIDTDKDPNEMNFSIIGDIPGNLTGGIGKDQAANPIGCKPSTQDDARIAKGTVEISDGGPYMFIAKPALTYEVKDTVDLCPGDCGSTLESQVTVPMSRWEATGISGDVPYTVEFPSNAAAFYIPKTTTSTPPPGPGAAPTPGVTPTPAKP